MLKTAKNAILKNWSPWEIIKWQSLKSGCHIHNGTYLTLSLTLTITLTLLILILGTVVNMAPAFQGLPKTTPSPRYLSARRIEARCKYVFRWLWKLRQLLHKLQTNTSVCTGNQNGIYIQATWRHSEFTATFSLQGSCILFTDLWTSTKINKQ